LKFECIALAIYKIAIELSEYREITENNKMSSVMYATRTAGTAADVGRVQYAIAESVPAPMQTRARYVAPHSRFTTSRSRVVVRERDVPARFDFLRDPAPALTHGHAHDHGDVKPLCAFNIFGKCKFSGRGELCKYEHKLPCMFHMDMLMGRGRGCRFGERCRKVHMTIEQYEKLREKTVKPDPASLRCKFADTGACKNPDCRFDHSVPVDYECRTCHSVGKHWRYSCPDGWRTDPKSGFCAEFVEKGDRCGHCYSDCPHMHRSVPENLEVRREDKCLVPV